jgi:hypothetical protein
MNLFILQSVFSQAIVLSLLRLHRPQHERTTAGKDPNSFLPYVHVGEFSNCVAAASEIRSTSNDFAFCLTGRRTSDTALLRAAAECQQQWP